MKTLSLREDQALVMQIIDEAGQEELDNLAETLRFDRHQLVNILINLQHKGLVSISATAYGTYAELTSRGRKMVGLIWPEIPYLNYS